MNLSSKEQRWVWNLVTWKWGSNFLKRKAFVSRKPKALWMVLVVPQNNQDCSSDLLNTLCPGGSADGWAMSFVLQEVKFLLCHSWAKGWSNLWVCNAAGAFTWEETEVLRSATGLRYFHMSNTFTPFFWPTCFECLFPLCGLQLCPKGKEIICAPFMLFIVY